MTSPIGIFISHGWYTSELYREVVTILDATRAFQWANCSIPADNALCLSIEADERRVEELALLRERRATLLQELSRNGSRLERWSRWERLEQLIQEARERILDRDFARRLTGLEKELAEREAIGGVSGVERERARDLERKATLESDIARCTERIGRLEQSGNGARVDASVRRDRSVMNDANMPAAERLFSVGGKISPRLINNNISLSLAIANRVLRADVFFVLADSVVMYRKWVEFEFEVASFAGKRINKIGILPRDRSELPHDLRYRCERVVKLDANAIVQAVLDCAGRQSTFDGAG